MPKNFIWGHCHRTKGSGHKHRGGARRFAPQTVLKAIVKQENKKNEEIIFILKQNF